MRYRRGKKIPMTNVHSLKDNCRYMHPFSELAESLSGSIEPTQLLLDAGGVNPEQIASLLQGHTHSHIEAI